MKFALLFAVLASVVAGGLGARVLAMLPFFGKSHHIFTKSVLRALIEQGHQVVEYGPIRSFESTQNYTHVEIHSSIENLQKTWTYEDFMQIANTRFSVGIGFIFVWLMAYKVCEETFQQDSVKKLLNSNEQFDVVFTESSFGQEAMVVFGHKFKAPTITIQGFSSSGPVNRDAGNSLSIATIPDIGSLVATDHMSFVERLVNFISTVMTLTAYYIYQVPSHDRLIRKYYTQDVPPLQNMLTNVSLYFVNTHPAIEYTRPYTPNIIPIGGITISPDRTSLPQNIQTFMDKATEGVVYFSLGTVVPAEILPKEVLQIYINVFKKLKQKVIWKIEIENMPGLPKNVLLTKWVPQPAVLAHPNCVLFMTHGGQMSQQEALNVGIPTIGIPYFGDQPFNVKLSEHLGVGKKLDFRTLSEETLTEALTTVLNDPKYRENAKKMSRIFKDRPMSPVESIVFWVEYVIRHSGAHHLRPVSANLPWYQLTLLDVLAVILVAVVAVLLTVYLVVKKLMSFVFKEKKQVNSSKKKN